MTKSFKDINKIQKNTSKLIEIIESSRQRLQLKPWNRIPESEWLNIAKQCGEDEKKEILVQLRLLDDQLKKIPKWDGDWQDDIFFEKQFLKGLLKLIK